MLSRVERGERYLSPKAKVLIARRFRASTAVTMTSMTDEKQWLEDSGHRIQIKANTKGEEKMASEKTHMDERHPDIIGFRQEENKLREVYAGHRQAADRLNSAQEARLSRSARVDIQATALLNGQEIQDVPTLEDLKQDVEVWDRAIEKQRNVVETQRGKFSKAIQTDPVQRARWRQIKEKEAMAKQLAAESSEERMQFVAELRRVGCSPINEAWLDGK